MSFEWKIGMVHVDFHLFQGAVYKNVLMIRSVLIIILIVSLVIIIECSY